MEGDFFELDKFRLDVEWENQPKLYYEAAMELAEASSVYERSKTERELKEAEISLDIRKNPSQYNIDKVTEGSIASTILVQADYKAALKEMQEARHKVDVMRARVDTLDHRKKALEKLVDLQLSNYFSKPRHSNEDSYFEARRQEAQTAFRSKHKKGEDG